MKYGETLRQRSIPGWAEHNIDYDEIKLLIKDATTPGKGKAVSVPGQGNEAESDFEKRLFGIFVRENANISLFVKTKVLEIECSLDDLDRRLRKLQLQSRSNAVQLSQARLEAYRRIEQRTVTTGEVIKSLSRFISTNRTAVFKLLKKYKKWTGSENLGPRVRTEILAKLDSFARVDVQQLLNHWTSILHDVRLATGSRKKFEELMSAARAKSRSPQTLPVSGAPRELSASVARSIHSTIQSESNLDFDLALAETPLGDRGRIAFYWVHPDQLIELQVFLSNHLKLYPPRQSNRNSVSSHPASPTHTRRASLIQQGGPLDAECDHGVILLDRLDDYAQRSSATVVDDADESPGQSVAATVRWTASDDGAVSVKGIAGTENIIPARIQKRYIKGFLDLERSFKPWQDSDQLSLDEDRRNLTTGPSPDFARNWLDAHRNINPLVSICSRRTRFIDLNDDQNSGQWCILDSDIEMNKVTEDDLVARDWPLQTSDGWRFPHAVLEVRQEGKVSNDLIALLERSHLVERVRGFSIAYHAIYMCWQPKSMTQPFWLPVLEKDIRKLPEAPAPHSRRKRAVTDTSTEASKRAEASSNDDQTSAEQTESTTLVGGSSGASGIVTPPGAQRVGQLKTEKRWSRHAKEPKAPPQQKETRYWNEYDYPEDGSGSGEGDDGYYIYVDPNEKFDWPFASIFKRLKSLFVHKATSEKSDEEAQPLLRSPAPHPIDPAAFPVTPTSATEVSASDDESSSSDLDTAATHSLNRWGVRRSAGPRPFNNGTFAAAPPTRYTMPAAGTALAAPAAARGQYPALRLSTVALTAALTILVTLTVLAGTGRRRQRGEVDAGVLFGVVATLAFALTGVLAALAGRRHDPEAYGAVRWVLIWIAFVVSCCGCGALLAWVGGVGL